MRQVAVVVAAVVIEDNSFLMHNNYVTNEELIATYVEDRLLEYLLKKSPALSRDEVILRVCEVLKYLYFGSLSDGPIPFNDELDEIWHLLILQTRQYQELMEKLPHKTFIHHNSNHL